MAFAFDFHRGAQRVPQEISVTAASAAGVHRFTVSQGAGSGGATNFLNTDTSGGALEGSTGSADTGIQIPFGMLGAYDNGSNSTFGVGVIGLSSTGYGVAGESLSSQPSILALSGGTGIALEAASAANSTADSIYSEAKGSGNGITAFADGNGEGGSFFSTNGAGLSATTENGDGAYLGNEMAGGSGAYIGEAQGPGIAAFGPTGNIDEPVIAAFTETSGTDIFTAYNGPTINGNPAYANLRTAFIAGKSLARGGSGLPGAADFQISGDIFVYGRIFQDCSTFPGNVVEHL